MKKATLVLAGITALFLSVSHKPNAQIVNVLKQAADDASTVLYSGSGTIVYITQLTSSITAYSIQDAQTGIYYTYYSTSGNLFNVNDAVNFIVAKCGDNRGVVRDISVVRGGR